MSDHWNSLADLLGTPSIDPLQRKATSPPKRGKEIERALPDSAIDLTEGNVQRTDETLANDDILAVSVEATAVKPVAPSRLRSSWDTVAKLFGVTTSEPTPPAVKPETDVNVRVQPPEEVDLFAGFGKKQDRNPPALESKRESTERPKKPSSFWSEPEPLRDEPLPSKSADSYEEELPSRSNRLEAPRDRDEGEPERRGRTRNIRRGRGSNASNEPTRDPSSDSPSDRLRSEPRSEAAPSRHDRSAESGTRNRSEDRPNRTNDRLPSSRTTSDRQRSDRSTSDRSTSDRSTSDRSTSDRATSDRSASDRSTSDRSTSDRATSDRSASDRSTSDRASRDAERSRSDTDRRPRSEDRVAKSTERGVREGHPPHQESGRSRPNRDSSIRREPERVAEEEGEWDSSEVTFERDDELDVVSDREISFDEVDVDSEETPPRRRRRRRGSRSSKRAEPDAVEESTIDDPSGPQAYGRHVELDEEDHETDEEVENVRIHKVTSWLDAISSMIDSNMENHKRSPGQERGRGGPRGNGNTRRRGGNSGSGGNR